MDRTNAAAWTGDKRNAGKRNDDPTQHNLMHLSMLSRTFESFEEYAPLEF
jgi:hypothetical protein